MLYMDVSWYDRSDAFELASRITGDTVKSRTGWAINSVTPLSSRASSSSDTSSALHVAGI
ncbi:hypothetical protein GQ600_13405 [Phytophthora cactorum]|nr:hypothetical protein GQ600_13405 [Phytophthora cactorum]